MSGAATMGREQRWEFGSRYAMCGPHRGHYEMRTSGRSPLDNVGPLHELIAEYVQELRDDSRHSRTRFRLWNLALDMGERLLYTWDLERDNSEVVESYQITSNANRLLALAAGLARDVSDLYASAPPVGPATWRDFQFAWDIVACVAMSTHHVAQAAGRPFIQDTPRKQLLRIIRLLNTYDATKLDHIQKDYDQIVLIEKELRRHNEWAGITYQGVPGAEQEWFLPADTGERSDDATTEAAPQSEGTAPEQPPESASEVDLISKYPLPESWAQPAMPKVHVRKGVSDALAVATDLGLLDSSRMFREKRPNGGANYPCELVAILHLLYNGAISEPRDESEGAEWVRELFGVERFTRLAYNQATTRVAYVKTKERLKDGIPDF